MHGIIVIYLLILAAFIGYEVVIKVPAVLHTSLLSGSNFVHGIVLIGSIIVLSRAVSMYEKVFGFLAVILSTINVVSGYIITHRILETFKRNK